MKSDRATETKVADHLRLMTPALRATVQAARKAVRAAAPAAREIACQTKPPRSNRPMWKIARYFLGDTEVAAIGTFSAHAHLYFQRGTELEDGSGLLEGGGKALRSIRLNTPLDAARPGVKRVLRRAFQLASEHVVRREVKGR
jgi:hypothetical protein